jgi:hypothetical protein
MDILIVRKFAEKFVFGTDTDIKEELLAKTIIG